MLLFSSYYLEGTVAMEHDYIGSSMSLVIVLAILHHIVNTALYLIGNSGK